MITSIGKAWLQQLFTHLSLEAARPSRNGKITDLTVPPDFDIAFEIDFDSLGRYYPPSPIEIAVRRELTKAEEEKDA